MDDDLVAAVDHFIEAWGYANRLEATRDLVRNGLQQPSLEVARGRD